MKKIILVFGILLIGCSTNKPVTVLNYSSYEIINPQGETMTVPSDEMNTLNPQFFEEFKKYLNEITNRKLDFSKKIVINFINNDPRGNVTGYQVPWDIFYGNLSRELNRIEKCNQIWINNIQVKNLCYYHCNKINWTTDKKYLIGSHFFNYKELNGGFLIIKPNGEYYRKVGEYSKSDLLKIYTLEKNPAVASIIHD